MRSVLSLLVFALPLALAAHQPNVNHRELAKRAQGDLDKRTSNARWTFYSTGLGACGGYNSDSDFIVALNQQTFGYSYPSQYCYKMISMTYNGKTTQAQITDSCPGCPVGGLDLSPGLFSFFASQDEGVIYGSWEFVDGSGGGGDTTTTKKTTTTTHHTTPTSTYTPPTTTTTHHTTPTSTYTPPTTTSTTTSTKKSSTTTSSSPTSSKAASSSSSSVAHSSASSNAIAAASGSVSPTSTADPENLYTFAQAFLGLTEVIVAGGNAA
ncbi:RlpA-like double-psi beta-barrel-protein domain-containing protein-containing protein [Mycena polygramma]|nr:RlpA-like double-psi beta-barrel-protein domain-containing protein-containing protein [Mycena polygramma]